MTQFRAIPQPDGTTKYLGEVSSADIAAIVASALRGINREHPDANTLFVLFALCDAAGALAALLGVCLDFGQPEPGTPLAWMQGAYRRYQQTNLN